MTDQIEISQETLDLLGRASTATLTTQLWHHGIRNTFLSGLAPLNKEHCRFVGEAVTLRYIPSREDLDRVEDYGNREHPQRKAIEMVGPGQVLVIDCRGETRAASAGNILTTRLRVRGAAGLVTDGALRDSPDIGRQPFPVFARAAAAPMSMVVHHAVDINVPIGCAGTAVFPGDILVGDEEGVVVVPRRLAAEIAKPAAEQEEKEVFILEKIEAGAPLRGTYPPDEKTLAEYEEWRKKQK
ncbi:MAG TPA: ribonuclease activity regulator RraA [Thermomicrobiales bacterium]|nr:ribonuclease activity regulator RraA [Thermomicrobiales bacterium]